MKKIQILFLLCLFLSPSLVSAQSFYAIDIEESFKPGDEIVFTYSIYEETELIKAVTPYLVCEKDLPQPIPNEVEISSEAGKTYKGEYKGIMLTPNIPSQKCRAIIATGDDQRIIAEKEFFIDSKPALDVSFLFCTDETCGEETKVFSVNQPIYVKSRSNFNPPLVAIFSSEKNGIMDRVVLPDYYKFKEAGDYYITFEALSDNFQKISQEKYITVVENIIQACNNNGKCDVGENLENCGSDCAAQAIKTDNSFLKNNQKILFIAVLLFFAILLVTIAFYILKIKKKQPELENNNIIKENK